MAGPRGNGTVDDATEVDHSRSLLDFYQHQVLPKLRPEQIYTDPIHQWQPSTDRWRGACPWHRSESGTAFVVSPESLLWYCAGCGVGGGPIQYLWKLRGGLGASPRGPDFVDVLRKLADLAGVPFPERHLTPEVLKAVEDRAARQSALETVYIRCQQELWLEHGAAARTYLHSRGLSDEAIHDLGLGLYPALDAIKATLKAAGYQTSANEGAWKGLVGYITFPWRDESGYALTLYGRWPGSPPAGQPKTTAQPGQHSKSSPLYFDRARRAGHRALVLVEGVLDAAVAQARGLTDVVAYVGSTPSRDQLATLKRAGITSVTICSDPDQGGETGIKSLLTHIDPSIRTYVAPRLPDDTDPDQFILANGVDGWREHLGQAVRGAVWSAQAVVRDHDLASIQGRDAALDTLRGQVARLEDQDLVAIAEALAASLKLKPAALLGDLKRAREAAVGQAHAAGVAPRRPLPYRVSQAGLVWDKPIQGGTVPVLFANFTARIIGDVERDDGSGEVQHLFEIEVVLGGRVRRFSLPAEKFNAMHWPTEQLGATAIVAPGLGTKDHTRAAIQWLSENVDERRVYTHTGLRRVDSQVVYLHAGGAVGPAGIVPEIEVQLPDALARYALPEPRDGTALIEAIHASLQVLEVAPLHLTVPLFGAIYRAPLGGTDFGLHYTGPTGAGKSELVALAQQHYGPSLDARHLPASWSSTGNALEGLAFAAKDVLLAIDDFAPGGSATDVQRYHRDADRVFRAQGNQAGRQRMRPDGSLRAAKPPRGVIVSTGEDTPRGQSVRARLLIGELGPADLDWSRLSRCQGAAADGLFALALVGFVGWVVARYERLQPEMREMAERFRQEAYRSGQHRRTPGLVAELAVGLRCFLDYAVEAGALSADEAESRWATWWAALGEAAAAQANYQAASEPAQRFLQLLSAALASGEAHVAAPDGSAPSRPEAWGWRTVTVGSGAYERDEWQPQGRRVGWLAEDALYLEPDAALAVVQTVGHKVGDALAIGPQTLRKRLHDRGLLASVDKPRETLTIRRRLEGRQREVLHLRAASLSPAQGPDKPDNGSSGVVPLSGRVSGLVSGFGLDPTPNGALDSESDDPIVGFVGFAAGTESDAGAATPGMSGAPANPTPDPTGDPTAGVGGTPDEAHADEWVEEF